MSMPVSSPCAPAAGCRLIAPKPLISLSSSASSHISSRLPWLSASGSSGCESASPGSRAAHSLTFGLYFIVHDPSG